MEKHSDPLTKWVDENKAMENDPTHKKLIAITDVLVNRIQKQGERIAKLADRVETLEARR